ncbi:MAG: DUF58 domain-containing protein [Bacteroidota bacterium]|nr:DUF58 domain-containing protein [Candidatus Kapabacteria bacterium]MDW8219081.1 DUF58 domain-containing protein [Bacteroidota bacterium]
MTDYRKYLEPRVISRIQGIDLKARLVVEGFITGLHKSPYHGFSIEFAEHRQYMPGDEIKFIDWKVFARTDRYYVKQYEDETNLRCTIILDASASMNYASQGNIAKFEYACYLAAAMAFLMMKQQDAVGLALYDTDIRTYLPAHSKKSYIQEILRTLGSAVPTRQTGTAPALAQIAERIARRGLVIVLSDFFDDVHAVISALKRFRHSNHEVLAFQILDPRERDFNFGYDALFRDMETGEEMTTQPQHIKAAYTHALKEFTEKLKKHCRERKIDYMLLDTAQPFDVALLQYLIKRRMIQG